tara:strand:+ start:1193 stop:1615 length:423 start_codon:yes stop_codon:yes gene_type:complete
MTSPWQVWAKKALNVKNDTFLMLLFHEDNIMYIIQQTRRRVHEATSMPSPKPDKKQLVITMMLIYENYKGESRKDLRDLLKRANGDVVGALTRKIMMNLSMYKQYYHDKLVNPVPTPMDMPSNVNQGGSRALTGGKPFVV